MIILAILLFVIIIVFTIIAIGADSDDNTKSSGIPLYRVGSAHGDTKYQFEEICKEIIK